MAQEQLYKACAMSGLKNMSSSELSGLATLHSSAKSNDPISECKAGWGVVGAYAPISIETATCQRTLGFQLTPSRRVNGRVGFCLGGSAY